MASGTPPDQSIHKDIHTISISIVGISKDMESMNARLAMLPDLIKRVQGLEDHNVKTDALSALKDKLTWAAFVLSLLAIGIDVGALKTWVSTHFLSRP